MKVMDRSLAPALQNGLNVLELLASRGGGVGFNEIAAHLGVSKATTSRLLSVLRCRNYVAKDEQSGKYRAGARMSLLNESLPIIEVLRREIPAVLESLMHAAGNTVLFIFWNGHELQCLNKKTHQGSVPMQEIGHVDCDLTAGPWGFLVYNSLDRKEQKAAESKFRKDRETAYYKEVFARWTKFYDKHGFCFDNQELYKPLKRLAAPIHDRTGKLAGALGIGGNSLTIKNNQVQTLGKILLKHAQMLMERI
jgi:DNA-binding IclR family transcriptional regulator